MKKDTWAFWICIIIAVVFFGMLFGGITPAMLFSSDSEEKAFSQKFLSLTWEDIDGGAIVFHPVSFDPFGEHPLTEEETEELFELARRSVKNGIFKSMNGHDMAGGGDQLILYANGGEWRIVIEPYNGLSIDDFVYGIGATAFRKLYETCEQNAYDRAMAAPRYWAAMEEGTFTAVTLQNAGGSYALTEEERLHLQEFLRVRSEFFLEKQDLGLDNPFDYFDNFSDGFAAPADEPTLCTYEIETADGNTFTVGIAENYFLVNGVGYYMGAYETLRDWTLTLLEQGVVYEKR